MIQLGKIIPPLNKYNQVKATISMFVYIYVKLRLSIGQLKRRNAYLITTLLSSHQMAECLEEVHDL